jgi:hypothetical protein
VRGGVISFQAFDFRFSSASWRSCSTVMSAMAWAITSYVDALALDRCIDALLPIDRHGIEPPHFPRPFVAPVALSSNWIETQ